MILPLPAYSQHHCEPITALGILRELNAARLRYGLESPEAKALDESLERVDMARGFYRSMTYEQLRASDFVARGTND